MASPVQIKSVPLNSPPFIPNTALDPCSTVALFALFTVLDKQDRFGIIGNKVEHQPSSPVEVPYFGKTDLQSLYRTYYGNSRDEACDFVHAITEALVTRLKDPSFHKLLPYLEKGLLRYVTSYGENDNATTTFTLGAARVSEAIQSLGNPDLFISRNKQICQNEISTLKERITSNWGSEDIEFVALGIINAQNKLDRGLSCKAYLEPLIKFISLKQDDVSFHLQTLQGLQEKK